MQLVTQSVLLVSAACFVLALINLRLWFGNRDRPEPLAISSVCFFGGAYALFEIGWMQTRDLHTFGEIARWSQVASWGVLLSLAIFLRLHLNAGRLWLLWAIVAVRSFGLLVNFLMPVNIQFREMTSIEQITILGEKLFYPIGTANPWHAVQAISIVMVAAFALDASRTVWRRGDRRRAVIFGGGVLLLCLTGIGMAAAVIWMSLKVPPFASPALMFVVLAMALEFEYDLRRSQRLAGELTDRERRLTDALCQLELSADAGQIGIWAREFESDRLWVNSKMRELFEFGSADEVTVARYLDKVHVDDRPRILGLQKHAIDTEEPYEAEYRITLSNGDVRWMRSVGQVEANNGGPGLLRGASVNITRRKLAEQAAHELSHKLMDAQEKERARLARELHDDLSQSLAILSIQLQSLAGETDAGTVREQVEKLTRQIQRLSSDVHRISHELHPAKLSQLGLESALRGFCREICRAHDVKIGFKASKVPRSVPNDISLCLYRIAQEAVQNLVKHSGSPIGNVELSSDADLITLVVSDSGCGFDPEATRSRESLGLISMRERVRAVDGLLNIVSHPGSGTRIETQVRVPTV